MRESNRSSGTTSSTRPMSRASVAESRAPWIMRSFARCAPRSRGSRWLPPAPGKSPSPISGSRWSPTASSPGRRTRGRVPRRAERMSVQCCDNGFRCGLEELLHIGPRPHRTLRLLGELTHDADVGNRRRRIDPSRARRCSGRRDRRREEEGRRAVRRSRGIERIGGRPIDRDGATPLAQVTARHSGWVGFRSSWRLQVSVSRVR